MPLSSQDFCATNQVSHVLFHISKSTQENPYTISICNIHYKTDFKDLITTVGFLSQL